jgi:hypothetical protein
MKPLGNLKLEAHTRKHLLDAIVSLAGALAIAILAHAQAATTAQPEDKPPAVQANPDHGTNKAPEITTSEAPGVLTPKVNPDPGITLPTPNPKEFPMPVIRPAPGKGGATEVTK